MSLTSRAKKQSIVQNQTGLTALFRNIGIRQKIGFGYALAITIATLGTLTGRIFELSYKHQIRQQINLNQEKVDLLSNLTKKVLLIKSIQNELPTLSSNPKKLAAQASQNLSNFYEINALFQQIKSAENIDNKTVENKINLQEFQKTYAEFLKVYINQLENIAPEIKEILNQSDVTTKSIALINKISNSKVTTTLEELLQDSEELRINFDQKVEQGLKDYQKAETLGIKLLIASLLLSIAVAAIMAILTSKAIASPLKAITKVAQQVTEEANFELQLPVTTNDEVGKLTSSLNQLIGRVAEYTEQLQEAKKKAEAANRSKSAFLATMSHELRTPLNAIIGYSEILYEEASEEGFEEFTPDLERIKIAGKHLLEMISDILDISKIEAGQVTLYLESIDVNSLVEDVISTAKNLAEKNRNTLKLVLGENLGSMYADMPKVRQVLLNLLSNAAKFTENGTITLTVERLNNKKLKNYPRKVAQLFKNSDQFIVFRVSDNGIGMTKEQLEQIFKPFTQADASTTRRYGGTGLGLAICQRLCERMGAKISVKSKHGVGSTFTVWFPERVVI
ncbi:MAG: HAMP domain-containing sensor histidine kinase [Microcoleaceae cyanobacterium MO_207.B10]|nr:HAMP domain-containing sensor histidine kinase [Microcoleaceae cyanobacterium MO_207.B10]